MSALLLDVLHAIIYRYNGASGLSCVVAMLRKILVHKSWISVFVAAAHDFLRVSLMEAYNSV